jgi:WD40 repeat protein
VSVIAALTVFGVIGAAAALLYSKNRDLADERDRAQAAEKRADDRADEASRQRTRAEGLLYASQLALAQSAWNEGNMRAAWQHLHATREDYRGWEYRYLSTLFNSNQRTFRGHTGAVTTVCYSPDGKCLASTSNDGTVRLWEADTGRELMALNIGTGSVYAMCFSPDGKRLACAVSDKPVRLWNVDTGQKGLTLKGPTADVTTLAFSPDGSRLATASRHGQVKVWDTQTGTEAGRLAGQRDDAFFNGILGDFVQVNVSLRFSPDGKRLAAAIFEAFDPVQIGRHFEDRGVTLWDTQTGRMIQRKAVGVRGLLLDRQGRMSGTTAAFSSDLTRVVTATNNGMAMVFNVDGPSTSPLARFTAQTQFSSVAFSPDGKHIATAGDEQSVKIWDAETGQYLFALKGHTHDVNCVCFSPDGKRLASASGDETVKVWDVRATQGPQIYSGIAGHPATIAWYPDSQHLLLAENDFARNMATKRNVQTGEDSPVDIGNLLDLNDPVLCLSPDGKRGVIANKLGGDIIVWDTTARKHVTLHDAPLVPLRGYFSPDGKRLAVAFIDQTVRLWDTATGKEILTLQGHDGAISDLCFGPDGRCLATASLDKTVKVWNAATGEEIRTFQMPDAALAVCFSPDGNSLAIGGGKADNILTPGTITLWNVQSAQQIGSLEGHGGAVQSVCFSPDGRRLASASNDGTVKLWDVERSQETLSLSGHTHGTIGSAVFSPDGKRLAGAFSDERVVVWDASQGE